MSSRYLKAFIRGDSCCLVLSDICLLLWFHCTLSSTRPLRSNYSCLLSVPKACHTFSHPRPFSLLLSSPRTLCQSLLNLFHPSDLSCTMTSSEKRSWFSKLSQVPCNRLLQFFFFFWLVIALNRRCNVCLSALLFDLNFLVSYTKPQRCFISSPKLPPTLVKLRFNPRSVWGKSPCSYHCVLWCLMYIISGGISYFSIL